MRHPERRLRALAASSALWLVACGEPDPAEVFERTVVGVLERSCAASTCHGVGPDAAATGEVVDRSLFFVDVDAAGRIVDPAAARLSALGALVTDEDPSFSPLLRKPLAEVYGGQPHFGGENWLTPSDPDYEAVLAWARLETGGGHDAPPLDDLEQRFADTVQPALVAMTCSNGSCHGLRGSIPFRLDPGLDGAFSREMTRANYEAAVTMLSLDGDPSQSRLLRKALPLHDGGILHKGGNGAFLTGSADPRAEAIRAWACAERQRRVGVACATADAPLVSAFVYVRGPLRPEPLFELDAWTPGLDLHLATLTPDLAVASTRDLTGALHEGPADVRDPAVSADGQRVLFAMRRSEDEGHRIHELDLATGEVVQLTTPPASFPAGHVASDRDPTYGPDGLVWFVSNRAGVVTDGGDALDADLYTVDPRSGELTRRSWTPHFERKPTAYHVGDEAGGEIAFTALRDAVRDQARAHPFRFPDGLATEYHQHFGITPDETLFHDMRELPDGRYVTTIGRLDCHWGGVRLGVVDRNFGPEIGPRALSPDPGLPLYADPVVRLDPECTVDGVTGGMYRDPAPLPDGRVLATYVPGPFDLDAAASADAGIVVLTLTESVDRTGPRLGMRVVLLDEPGVAEFDPEPVSVRLEPVPSERHAWDPAAATGLLRHQGLPMIDALLANLAPSGPKVPRTDMVAARLVQAIPVGPDLRRPLVAGPPGATTTSLTPFSPARVLAEVPLAPDGTFHVELPAGTAFRIQALDARGMAVGHPHNRWFDVHPGQVIPQGVSATDPAMYGSLCAGCHGAADGDPQKAFVAPDVVTMASVTLSRYAHGNPRHPLPPARADASTTVEVDFARDVQPVLDAHCAGCHEEVDAAPEGPFSGAYTWLVAGPHVVPGQARRSPLLERLLGEELDAPGSPPSSTPHAGLDEDARLTLVRWIDLGASYVGTTEGR